ncbi:MAG TPA: hypothetical protein VJT72_15690 [Pseudonocardiaceae bacterium]|nr:hypothetical protein [Pseudonocardiaceae bacterium]
MGRHRSLAMLQKILFKGYPAPDPVATAPLFAMELVDSRTEITHRVTDEAFTAGRRAEGRYKVLCGVLVLPANLTTPGRGYCPACERNRGHARAD